MSSNLLRQILCASLLSICAAAQCQFSSLTSQFAGASCNTGSVGCCAVPANPVQLSATLDVTNCRVDFEVRAIEGCCSVVVPVRVLAIGLQAAVTPLPQFGASCNLWLVPDTFYQFSSRSVSLPIPPTLPPLTFLAQGAALVLDTFTPNLDTVAISAAAAITLQ